MKIIAATYCPTKMENGNVVPDKENWRKVLIVKVMQDAETNNFVAIFIDVKGNLNFAPIGYFQSCIVS